jgi:hypothetical protein
MTYIREPVRIRGVLRGGEHIANCMVSAVRATLSGTRLIKNFQHSIISVSKPLPEGDYKLSVEDEIINVRYSKGDWQLTDF